VNGWLEKILEAQRERLRRARRRVPLRALKDRLPAPPGGRLEESLRAGEGLAIIAEIKRASPSRGLIRKSLDPAGLARAYEGGGANAISVLTEERFFQGSFEDLLTARAATRLPILCKDFIIDPYQVHEARAHGADAVLLIAAILEDGRYQDLSALALDLGMTPVVEVHDHGDLRRAQRAALRAVGVNRRCLKTFRVDQRRCQEMVRDLPAEAVKIAESGVRTREEAQTLVSLGYDACLVGEALVRSADPEALMRSWTGPPK
jgi:indole-3-glycerol phosphate synthase